MGIEIDQATISVLPRGPQGPAGVPGSPGDQITFATRTAAAAATIGSGVNFLNVAGYSVVGDGGAALYVRRASEPSHPGKFQNVDGSWWELIASPIKPQMLGAVNNDTTDDSTPLQAAINTAIAKKVALYCPGGAGYRLTATLTINGPLLIYGDGFGSETAFANTTLHFDAGIHGINISTTESVVLRDLTIGVTASATNVGVIVTEATTFNTYSLFENIRFNGFGIGLYFIRAANWTVKQCLFRNAATNSIIIEDQFNMDAGDSTITECTFSGNPSSAHIRHMSGGALRIVNNKIASGARGYLLDLAVGAVSVGTFLGMNSIEGQTIAGIQMVRQGTTGGFAAHTIVGNEIGAARGIYIPDDLSGIGISHLICVGNNITFDGAEGVTIGTVSMLNFSSNIIRNIGAGNPLVIASTVIGGVVANNVIDSSVAPTLNSTSVRYEGVAQRGIQSVAVTTASGALFTGTASVTFAVPFLETPPHVSATIRGSTGLSANIDGAATTTGFTLRGWAVSSGTYTVEWEARPRV